MRMTLQNWGILRGLEYLSEAEKEFDYHGVVSLHGDEALEAINGITELRLQVRRAVWEREADLLPRDGETCETINRMLRVLSDAGCLDIEDDPVFELTDALLRASAALHLVVNHPPTENNNDTDDDAEYVYVNGRPPTIVEPEPSPLDLKDRVACD